MGDVKVSKRECVVQVDPKSRLYDEAKALSDAKTRRDVGAEVDGSWMGGALSAQVLKKAAAELTVALTDGEPAVLTGEQARFIATYAKDAHRELGAADADREQALILKSDGCND